MTRLLISDVKGIGFINLKYLVYDIPCTSQALRYTSLDQNIFKLFELIWPLQPFLSCDLDHMVLFALCHLTDARYIR